MKDPGTTDPGTTNPGPDDPGTKDPGPDDPGTGPDKPGQHKIVVTPQPPKWVDAKCGVDSQVYIPTVKGVVYDVSDVTPSPGQHVRVAARASKGYRLAASVKHIWWHTFGPAPKNCGSQVPDDDTDNDTTPPTSDTGSTDVPSSDGHGGSGAGGSGSSVGGSTGTGNGGHPGGKGGKGTKPRGPEILGVEATTHNPGSGVSLEDVTTVVSSRQPVSGGVAVPTAVDAGLASYSRPEVEHHPRLLDSLQLTFGGVLLLVGGWGLRRRPRRG
ncbi:MAG: hypothetical protein ACTHOK_04925 [Nocardioidaceae bacterium]